MRHAPVLLIRAASIVAAVIGLSGCATGLQGETQLSRFTDGDLTAREQHVSDLRGAVTAPGQANYMTARSAAAGLYDHYNRRAERQQTFMDIGSALTFVSAAPAFEGGISSSTRTAWAIAAFAPTVVTQFNAYEPTRELFHGGALAVQLITARYDRILEGTEVSSSAFPDIDCRPYTAIVDRVIAWSNVPTRRAWDTNQTILNEAGRLLSACNSLASRKADLNAVATYADSLRPRIAARYVNDLLLLDHALVGQDRELRYTPAETLGALVSSPLRAADMLLTGSSTKAAIDAIATLNAFRGMNQSLGSVQFPPLPANTPPTAAPSALLRERIDAQGTPADVVAVLRELHVLHQQLARAEATLAFRLSTARAVFEAAAADQLTFSFDIGTRTTLVKLGPAAPAPVATATTASVPPAL